MKYLEGGSTGVAEQGGLKAEAAEAVTRQCRDERYPMRASDDDDDDLDWIDPTTTICTEPIRSPSIGMRLKRRCSWSEGLKRCCL